MERSGHLIHSCRPVCLTEVPNVLKVPCVFETYFPPGSPHELEFVRAVRGLSRAGSQHPAFRFEPTGGRSKTALRRVLSKSRVFLDRASRDASVAMDLEQETFLRALEYEPTHLPVGSPDCEYRKVFFASIPALMTFAAAEELRKLERQGHQSELKDSDLPATDVAIVHAAERTVAQVRSALDRLRGSLDFDRWELVKAIQWSAKGMRHADAVLAMAEQCQISRRTAQRSVKRGGELVQEALGTIDFEDVVLRDAVLQFPRRHLVRDEGIGMNELLEGESSGSGPEFEGS